MNTPTPRTDAAVKLTFAAGHNTICPNFARTLERELTALTADRAELAADCENETKWAAHYLADALAAKARAERAEAAETVALAKWNGALERALKAEAERDHLHAQLRALTLICGTNDANRFETWIDRANARAEKAEAELAIERARLNWLETPSGMDWQWEPERLTVSRASIDAAMKEDAK